MGYIYKIYNDVNLKLYIGKTEYNDPTKRWREHLNDYKQTHHKNRPLYSAMNKYGEKYFHFEIIEKANDGEILCEREKFWINELRTYVGFKDCNGYNATLGGDGKGIYNFNHSDVVETYFKNNKNMAQTARDFGVNINTIREILQKNNIKLNTYQETLRNIGSMKIIALNKDTLEVEKEFPSITEANIFFNKDKTNGNIRCALKDLNKTAYGYKWAYA